MSHSSLRRRLLLVGGLVPWLPRARATATQRAVIVGGGWGGLTLAAELRRLAPQIEVVLIDRQPAFGSFIGSNRWLVDAASGVTQVRHAYAPIAAARGYRFVQATAQAVEVAAQRLHTTAGALAYDWLILSPGIRENYAAWGLRDTFAVDRLKSRFSGAMQHPDELPALKARLARFQGGVLLMNLPPLPYRCPPAPYERALCLAWWLKRQRLPGKLVIIDPNPLMGAFRKVLLTQYGDQVSYLDHTSVQQVDPEKRVLTTEIEDIAFDEAILSPPQQAADLLWDTGLIRRMPDGLPDGWGAQDASDFHSALDDHIYIIGDAAGVASPLFGHYPKTGHTANRQALIVARTIAARAGAAALPAMLPASVCHVQTGIEPPEAVRIETDYRRRGDGFLMQNVRQTRDEAGPEAAEIAAQALAQEFLLP